MPAILNQRKKYDTFLVWLYKNGKEHLVPVHIKSNIPCSTIATWKHIDYSTYYGYGIRTIQHEAIAQYELLAKYRRLKKILYAVIKSWETISDIVLPVLQKEKKYEERFINEIQRLFTVMPRETALKIAGLSSSAFHERLSRIKVKCGLSPLALCIKRHPLQLAVGEVKKIKALFTDAAMACWPAISLYYEGLRNWGLYIALSTFYKYANLLGLKRKWHKKPEKTKGLEASAPNQYLHVDTTYCEQENIGEISGFLPTPHHCPYVAEMVSLYIQKIHFRLFFQGLSR